MDEHKISHMGGHTRESSDTCMHTSFKVSAIVSYLSSHLMASSPMISYKVWFHLTDSFNFFERVCGMSYQYHFCPLKLTMANSMQVPLTNPYPGPHSILVLDNCNIHHSDTVYQLIEIKACMLSFHFEYIMY